MLIISRRSTTFSLKDELVLANDVITGVLDPIVVGVDDVDFGVSPVATLVSPLVYPAEWVIIPTYHRTSISRKR